MVVVCASLSGVCRRRMVSPEGNQCHSRQEGPSPVHQGQPEVASVTAVVEETSEVPPGSGVDVGSQRQSTGERLTHHLML